MSVAQGDLAVVTGAGGDIGRTIAATLVEAGYTVAVADINLGAAEATCREIGTGAKPFQVDITDKDSVAAMAEALHEWGQASVLVNNAGAVTSTSLQTTDIEQWRQDMAVNLEGAVLCFRALEVDLKATKGSLVNIASVNGLGVYGHPGYSAAKAGLIHFTRLVAVEYGKFGIRANAVAPGTVRTQAWNERAEANPQIFEDAKRWYPLQRIARPQDVANAVRFLVSPMAEAISGVVLPVDCGLTAGQTELAYTFSQSRDY